jgi:hypothetical protein
MKAPLLVLAICAMSGCTIWPAFALSEDTKVARRQLEQLVPVGTSQAVAEQTLRAKGFTVQEWRGDFRTGRFDDYLLGSYEDSGFFVSREWHAELLLKDRRVADYRVSFGLTGL